MSQEAERGKPPEPAIVLYDGVCNLCSGTVRFIVKRDPARRFRFAALQSEAGRALLARYGLSADGTASIVLIQNGRAFQKSGAVLRILQQLHGPWALMGALRLVPRVIRDACYDMVAGRRYRWFGRKAACEVPTEDMRDRFL
jgi:predicted DCC family thiol-disulfide oxidoreductase YuxK